MPAYNLIQIRKGTSTEWANQNPILSSGEPGFDISNNILKLGDGVTAWSNLDPIGSGFISSHTEINVLSQEPQGFVNRIDSSISFNDSTRTFTIQPTGSSYDVYIEGIKVTKTGIETVVIDSGTALNYIHFDTDTNQLQTKTSFFNFDTDVPIAFIHWNSGIGQSTFFGEERHGIRMDTTTHKWIHNTFGMQYINGLSIGNYVLEGNGTSNSHAQMSISDGTLYQEDIIINIMDGDNGFEFTQQLSPTGYFPVYYHSGITGQWVRDSGTPYPVKYNATRALYNSYSAGIWSVANVPNNRYFAMWLVATNDINDPILSIMGQREDSSLGAAENNNNWTDIDLTNIPANELRPLYRLIFLTNDTFTNTPKSSLYSILDLRRSVLTTTYGVPQNDHGNLFGLGDDDHSQYVHINEARTITANHTLTNGLTINGGLLSATSGNFTQSLNVNSSGIFASGLSISNQTASTIASFDSNKNVASLSTATYPSLTELSYVKGVTSAIQTQIDSKAATSTTITAGSGLAGGGSLAANRTIDVGQGDGITVSADSIAVDSTVIRTTGVQTMSGAKTFTAATVFSTGVTISSSGTNVPLTITNDGTGNSFLVNDVTGDTSPFVINNNGSVGIGTSSPSNKLEVRGGEIYKTTTDFILGIMGSVITIFNGASTGNTYGAIGVLSAGGTVWNDLVLQSGGGNIGIGTTGPRSKLDVRGLSQFVASSNGTPALGANTYYTSTFENLSGGYGLGINVNASTGIVLVQSQRFDSTATAYDIGFQTLGGNVGIAETSPARKLHVKESSGIFTSRFEGGNAVGAAVEIKNSTTRTWEVSVAGSTSFGLVPTGSLYFYDQTAGLARLTLSTTGSLLTQILGTASVPTISNINDTNTGIYWPSSDNLFFSTAGEARLQINSTGNIGINNAPVSEYKLFVNGGTRSDSSTTSPSIVSIKSFTNAAETGDNLSSATYGYSTTSGSHTIRNVAVNTYFKINSGVTNSASSIGIVNNNLRNYGLTDDAGTLTSLFGIYNQYGHYNTSVVSPTTTTVIGIQNLFWQANGTITTAFDMYCSNASSGATVTNRWGIYVEHTGNNYFGGNLGIAISPTQKLHVARSGTGIIGRFTDATTQTLDIGVTASAGMYFDNPNGGYQEWQISGSGKMRLTGGGELLIGTTTDNGAYLLQVNSQIYATNATIATSDIRFKTNVQTLTNATNIIESLRPVTFDFIPQSYRNFAIERQVGLIAQETLHTLKNTDYVDSVVAKCGDHLGLAYEKLIPVLIRALQESNARIAALEARL